MDKVKLVKVAKINMGQSPPSSAYNRTGEGLPFFQGKADFGDIYPKVRFYCTEPKKIAQKDDILMSVRAPVGSININKVESCIGRGLAAIRNSKDIEHKYLYHFLNYYEPKLAEIGKGSTFEAVNREDVENIEIPLPKPDEQKRIAAILDKADRLRRQRRFAQTLSDSFLQSVFIKMFGDPVSNPMNWKEIEILEVCKSIIDCVNKTAQTVDFRTPYKMIRTSNVKKGEIDLRSVRYVTKVTFEKWTRRAIPEKGDVILTREAPLGEVGILTNEKNVFLGQRLVQYKVNPSKLNNYYLLHSFQAKDLQRQLKRLGAGSTVEHVAVPDCEKLLVKLPPLPLQEKFAEIVQKFERIRRQQREATRQAEHLFQTLLHRAFRGEL